VFGLVLVVWTDNAQNETAYIVERALDFDGAFAEIARLPANTRWSIDGNLPAGTYLYRVRAATEDQVSTYSNVVRVDVR
jgi:hypothetical protein